MAKVLIHNDILCDIANAIREKMTDNRYTFYPKNFSKYILAIDKKPTQTPLVSTVTSSMVTVDDSTLTAIGNAIRSKLGVSTLYLPSEMPAAIRSIKFSDDTSSGTGSGTTTPTVPSDWSFDSGTLDAEWWANLKAWLKVAPENNLSAKVGEIVGGSYRVIDYSNRHFTFECTSPWGSVPFELTKTGDPTTLWNQSSAKLACDDFYNHFAGKDSIVSTTKTLFLHGKNTGISMKVFFLSRPEIFGTACQYTAPGVSTVTESGSQYTFYKTASVNDRGKSRWLRSTQGFYSSSTVPPGQMEQVLYIVAMPYEEEWPAYDLKTKDIMDTPSSMSNPIYPAFRI